MKSIEVLSLFDGISCGKVALDEAGIPVSRYVAYEIDERAIECSKNNHSGIEYQGDVRKADFHDYRGFDLLMGGSPCQDMSTLGSRKGLQGTKSSLFYQFLRALEEAKPRYFLLENNANMPKEAMSEISTLLGVHPTRINSKQVVPQNRDRLYWVGKRNPDGSYDQVDVTLSESPIESLSSLLRGAFNEVEFTPWCRKRLELLCERGSIPPLFNLYNLAEVTDTHPCLTTNGGKHASSAVFKQKGGKFFQVNSLGWERLQGLPEGYTCGLSESKRKYLIGNGWTIPVIRMILESLLRAGLVPTDKFTFTTKPWGHQLKALEYLYERDCGAIYTVPGSGKTKVIIDLIVNRGFKRVLVVAPKIPCKDVWADEIQLHSHIPKKSVILLSEMDGEDKAALLKTFQKPTEDEGVTIFICNYDSVWREPVRRVWFYKRLAIDCVVCDESHKIKSPGGKCSAFLAQLAKRVPHRYAMTGTPLAESPEDVYAQYRFIDHTIFGTNFQEFCNQYVNYDLAASASKGYQVKDKKNPYKNLDDLRKKMFSCAFSMPPTVKLPKTTRMTLKTPMDQKTEALYNELVEEGAVELKAGYMTTENILTAIVRRQQVASGYIALEDDEGDQWLERISTYRRTALLRFLRGIPQSEPVVVFAKFRKDLYSIRKVAERLGGGYSEVSGKENTLSEWKKGETRILGVQYGSGAEGINLTRAHICVFYSLDHSLAKYEQALKRIHRPGQKQPCIYYHMVATKSEGRTIDQDILQSLKQKKDYVNLVMTGEKSL